MDNPLLQTSADGLPAFDKIRPEHAEPAVDAVLARNRVDLARLLDEAAGAPALGDGDGAPGSSLTWEHLVEPLEELSERLARAWGPISHLFAVTATHEWRAAHNACLPKVTEYFIELSQSRPLFEAYRNLGESPSATTFSAARKKVIRDALRDFKLSGIALEEKDRARYGEIVLRLSELQSKFSENVIDSVQAFSKHVEDEAELAGMTSQGKAAARVKAKLKGQEGFRLTLDFPSYEAVISYADNRMLRQELYNAYATRASDSGPLAGKFDNGPLIDEILTLRHEQAKLLGFSNYAEVSLATKMASSTEAVERFLLDLNRRARPRAEAELDELRQFARKRDGLTDFQPWDLPYYAEKLKEHRLGFSEDELRPYFQATEVIRGMFALVERLYGIAIEATTGVPVWHPDVTTYRVHESGQTAGYFYLDAFARDDKRGGAWMDECVGRRRTAAGVQHPVAYLTCNFAPPSDENAKTALLTHDEVVTLFHEFGHGLHHMLTRVDEAAVSGIRGVEWDAVELPSQFMENWCFDGSTLRSFSRHAQTGAPLPDALLEKLRASRTFHAALGAVRQLEFALFDLRLHRDFDPARGSQPLPTLAQVRREVSVLVPPAWNRMPNSFSHIFGGGYAAGYYSYKWAEVLSADAFAAFEESNFSSSVGKSFRDNILARGGSQAAMELFLGFRGREPTIDALLRQSGLSP